MAPCGYLLLPLIFIASARIIFAQGVCGGELDNPCEPVDERICAYCTQYLPVPNPQDCNSYYQCDGEFLFMPDPLPCPDGEIFDQTELKCKSDGKCTPYCDKLSGGDCFYACEGNPAGMIADPFDCSVYHKCSDTEAGPAETCPADKPYFNGEECVVDDSACCHCQPYCYTGDTGKMVEDPTDCRKYFVCTADNEVPSIQSECKDNEHFDHHARECSSTAPCVTLCRNVVDKDGCIDPYTCQEAGYFPICTSQCLQDYYQCLEVSDDYASTETCSDDLLFNPDTLQCTKNETCPYHKSLPH
ncbi:hypothetical protein O3P69_019597 [Scylla paramamosain]|uniref:Chitin-binding type-2 domain-containing protein n=1 Tax=Scylla paramamosain TaxID=85552 RepID=A0AAW0SXK7_SCYPA